MAQKLDPSIQLAIPLPLIWTLNPKYFIVVIVKSKNVKKDKVIVTGQMHQILQQKLGGCSSYSRIAIVPSSDGHGAET